MSSILRTFQEHVHIASTPSYKPLSASTTASVNNSASRASTRCMSSFKDPTDVRSHQLRSLYHLFGAHVPGLTLLLLAGLRATVDSFLSTLMIALLLGVFLFTTVMDLIESSFIYAPNVPDRTRFFTELPAATQNLTWRIVRLKSPSAGRSRHVDLKCLLILQSDSMKRIKAPTILFIHGNAGNVGHRIPLAKVLHDSCGANIFLLEYRGFGYSTGYPNELGIYADAMTAFNYLAEGAEGDVNGDNIFVFGRSLGGAVAIDIATRSGYASRIRGAIIENTFCSIADMGHMIGSGMIGWMTKFCLPTWALVNRFESLKKIKTRNFESGRGKFLFLSGTSDELIPPSMMTKLAKAWAISSGQSDGLDSTSWVYDDPKQFLAHGQEGLVRFDGGGHGTTWVCQGFDEVVKKFIISHSLTEATSTNVQ